MPRGTPFRVNGAGVSTIRRTVRKYPAGVPEPMREGWSSRPCARSAGPPRRMEEEGRRSRGKGKGAREGRTISGGRGRVAQRRCGEGRPMFLEAPDRPGTAARGKPVPSTGMAGMVCRGRKKHAATAPTGPASAAGRSGQVRFRVRAGRRRSPSPGRIAYGSAGRGWAGKAKRKGEPEGSPSQSSQRSRSQAASFASGPKRP